MSLLKIFSHAPLWVWAVLVALLLLGLRATRRRKTRVWMIVLPAFLIVLALRSMFSMHAAWSGWLALVLAYVVGASIGLRVQPRWTLGKKDGRVALEGEGVSITLMLALFVLNFAAGVLTAVAPALLASIVFQIGFGVIEGLASGSFLGRALCVLKMEETGA